MPPDKPKKTKKKPAAKPKVSRQLAWQREQTKAGKCWRCAQPLGKSPYSTCVPCAEADRKRKRKEEGSRPWKPGGRGRPPLAATKKKSA